MYQLSARNQFTGKIVKITEGAVNGVVVLDVNGENVSGTISMEAIKSLDLAVGKEAVAVIKATEVMVGKGKLPLSARNQFPGKVVSITEGAVNAVVKIEVLGGNTITANITIAAVKELGLTVGGDATAVVKATSVMIGI